MLTGFIRFIGKHPTGFQSVSIKDTTSPVNCSSCSNSVPPKGNPSQASRNVTG